MKKIVLASSLILGGVWGFVGLMISHAIKVEDGYSYKSLIALIFERGDSLLAILFIALLLVGIVIGIIGAFSNEKEN